MGNDAIFKCSVPSFVSDFVSVQAWVDNEANSYEFNIHNGNLVDKWMNCECVMCSFTQPSLLLSYMVGFLKGLWSNISTI